MATNIRRFGGEQGALTVFFDLIHDEKEPSSIQFYMESTFPLQQYVYQRIDQLPDCDTVLDMIMEKRDRMDIILPAGNRMVFCYYLDLRDLDQALIDDFYENAGKLTRKQPVYNQFDQHHVFCFRHKVAEMDRELIEKKADLIIDLMTRDKGISKEIFLLRTTAFEHFDNQEHGLVNSLFFASRNDNSRYIQALNQRPMSLRMVAYDDYYENRYSTCDAGIREVNDWQTKEADPDLSMLKSQIAQVVLKSLGVLRSLMQGFWKRSTLFPVNVNDFEEEKFLFITTGYKSKIGRTHPLLIEERNRLIEGKKESLIGNADINEVSRFIAEQFHYPDIKKLCDPALNLSSDVADLVFVSQGNKQPEEERSFASEMTNDILEKIRKLEVVRNIDDPDVGEMAKMERKKRNFQKEQLNAGNYQNLEHCFKTIDESVRPTMVGGFFGDSHLKTALVNDECNERLSVDPDGVKGFTEVYTYDQISPCQITVTEIYNMADLEDREKAVSTLKKIID